MKKMAENQVTVTVGQFAISECVVEVKTATDTYSPIADLE